MYILNKRSRNEVHYMKSLHFIMLIISEQMAKFLIKYIANLLFNIFYHYRDA